MMESERDWPERFRDIYLRGVERYRKGQHDVRGFFSDEEGAFLAEIGCSKQELFDFVEDAVNDDEPSLEEALLIQAERRDFLRREQGGQLSDEVRMLDSFPAKTDELDGIAWLPRLIAKAQAKLRGALPPELMYG